MTIGLVAATTGAVVSPGMAVGFALSFQNCHNISSSDERIALPRPQNNAIRGQAREFADHREIGGFKRRIRAQVAACSGGLERLFRGFVREGFCFRVLIGPAQNGAPQITFGVTHGTPEAN